MTAILDRDYEKIRQLVYEFSRINLGDHKKELVTARLGKRLRTLSLETFTEYCDYLDSPQGAEEMVHLVDSISTNHTHFFRETRHFDFMKEVALPEWIKRLQRTGPREIRVWSAASSSGEEPYSLAIFLAEYLEPTPEWRWLIEGTDISTRILEKARMAVYAKDRLNEVRSDLLRKYFQRGTGKWQGYFRVKSNLRDKIRFTNLNLLQGTYPFTEPFHVIFCRNVMIYFDRETQEQLVGHLYQHLLPGGYLMIGHSESLTGVRHSLKSVRPAVYQRPLSS